MKKPFLTQIGGCTEPCSWREVPLEKGNPVGLSLCSALSQQIQGCALRVEYMLEKVCHPILFLAVVFWDSIPSQIQACGPGLQLPSDHSSPSTRSKDQWDGCAPPTPADQLQAQGGGALRMHRAQSLCLIISTQPKTSVNLPGTFR